MKTSFRLFYNFSVLFWLPIPFYRQISRFLQRSKRNLYQFSVLKLVASGSSFEVVGESLRMSPSFPFRFSFWHFRTQSFKLIKEIWSKNFCKVVKKLKISRFIIRTDGEKFRKKIQLSVEFISHFPDIYTFSFAKAGENMHAFHALFSPASLQGRETGGSVRLCRTQTLSPFMCNVKQVTHILELGQYLGCLDRRP